MAFVSAFGSTSLLYSMNVTKKPIPDALSNFFSECGRLNSQRTFPPFRASAERIKYVKAMPPAEMRKETIIPFDTTKYPFENAVRKVLEVNVGPLPPFSLLHTCEQGARVHKDKSGNSVNWLQAMWNAERSRMDGDTGKYSELEEIYRLFVSHVIGPQLGGGRIIYQRAPSLRIFVPSFDGAAMGKLHNDRLYHHQPTELNYWMPLCSVFGTNSLWTESEPGRADFHPVELDYGQCFRFYGNLCRHMTHPNDSGRTRVSLDFRAVSNVTGGHDPNFRRGVRRGAKAKFQTCFDVGGFYEEMVLPENDNFDYENNRGT